MRQFARRSALLGRGQLERWGAIGRMRTAYTLPLRVVLTRNGVPIEARASTRGGAAELSPVFETIGPRVFPDTYKTLLQSVFTQARPTMDIVFGVPAIGGDVRVSNYDADIQDRLAVAGGYYIPNVPGIGPEIRFPVFNSPVSAAVNYVHCLLLAYQGGTTYPFDAVEEGLVRAATMRVVRTPGALPDSPDPAQVEQTLDSLYDVSAFYDWYNQPALGCREFIAPNLLNTQLPAGGSTGGIFLLRYQMAGTAWAKVTAEHPAFISALNAEFYASPAAYQTMPAIVALGQQVLDALVGGSGTVEGLSFADWVERQCILDTDTTAGMKVMVQPFPILATGGTSDFGVFAIDVNAFRTAANGDESLLAGTAYPIYWRPDFTRFFASVQDDQLKFSGAYASVAPNFTGAAFGGEQYRAAVDVPFLGLNTRVVLPAGSISTGTDPLPKNFYGTLTGLPSLAIGNYEVSIEWVGGSQIAIPAQNFAFGVRIADAGFDGAQPVTVRVYENTGTPSEVFSRRVNKGVGALALNLVPPEAEASYSTTVLAQLTLMGVPLQPYRVRPTVAFQTSDDDTLFARWNPTSVRYDLFPDAGQVMSGQGFFLRLPTATAIDVRGHVPPMTPISVALQTGWNAFTVPFAQAVGTSNIGVTVATEAVSTFAEALGTIIGPTVFEFVPDGGNPDAGTMVPATNFEPGKGYMVRALRPEGAVMVFIPNDFSPGGPSPQRGWLGRPETGGGPGYAREMRWETSIEFRNGVRGRTSVIVGQSSLTKRGFDPKRDSELPPSPGGFQALIVAGRPMYKDLGVWGDDERFKIKVTGLTKGERCVIEVSPLLGNKALTLYDPATGKTVTFRNGRGRYFFNATAASQAFEVSTGGRA